MIPSWKELTSCEAELKYMGWKRTLECGYHDHYTYDRKAQAVKRVRVFVSSYDEDAKQPKHERDMPMPSVYYRLDGDPIRERFWTRYKTQREARLHLMARHHRDQLSLLQYCKEHFKDVPDVDVEAMVHCALIGDTAQLSQTRGTLLEKVAQDYRLYYQDGSEDRDGVPVAYCYPLVLHTKKHSLPEVVLSVKHGAKRCSVKTLTSIRYFSMEDTEVLESLGLQYEQPCELEKREIAVLKLLLFLQDYLDEGEDSNYDDTHRVDLGIEPSWAEAIEREHDRIQAQVDIRRNDLTDYLPEEMYWEASPADEEDNLVNLTGVMGKKPMGRVERGMELDPEVRIGMTFIDLVSLEGDPEDSHFAQEEYVDFVRQRKEINGSMITYPNKEFLPKDKRLGWTREVECAVRGSLAFGGKVRLFHRTSRMGDRWAKNRYYENGEPVPGRHVGARVWQICGSCDRKELEESPTRHYHRQSQKMESCFECEIHRDVCLNCGSDKQVVVALAYVPAVHLSHLFDFPSEPYPARHYLRFEIYGQYVKYLMERRYEVIRKHVASCVPSRVKVHTSRARHAKGYAPKYMQDGRIFMMHPQAWNKVNQESQLLSYEHKMHGFEVMPKLFDDDCPLFYEDGYHVVLTTDYGNWMHDHAFQDDICVVDDLERRAFGLDDEWVPMSGFEKASSFAAKVRTAVRMHKITLGTVSKSPHWARI